MRDNYILEDISHDEPVKFLFTVKIIVKKLLEMTQNNATYRREYLL
jgi:hypothetical protein